MFKRNPHENDSDTNITTSHALKNIAPEALLNQFQSLTIQHYYIKFIQVKTTCQILHLFDDIKLEKFNMINRVLRQIEKRLLVKIFKHLTTEPHKDIDPTVEKMAVKKKAGLFKLVKKLSEQEPQLLTEATDKEQPLGRVFATHTHFFSLGETNTLKELRKCLPKQQGQAIELSDIG